MIVVELAYKMVNALQARSHNTYYETTRKNYDSPKTARSDPVSLSKQGIVAS